VDPHGDVDAAVGRLARRVLGVSPGLVLSGGGARGMAHLGVLEGLAERGWTFDRVAGTSMGGFVAALVAAGLPPDERRLLCRRELVLRNPFRDVTVPRVALMRGRATRTMLSRVFGERCAEELALDWFCVSADLLAAEVVVHRTGRIADAVAASMAVPGWFPPVRSGGRLLVDGGLLDNLPIDVMAATAEGPVVAVDVMGRFQPGRAGELPRLLDTLARATTLGSWRETARHRQAAAFIVTPDLPGVGMTSFDRFDDAVAAGRRAGLAAPAAVS
jgi:predicted acylesterase/phospholipase RssA